MTLKELTQVNLLDGKAGISCLAESHNVCQGRCCSRWFLKKIGRARTMPVSMIFCLNNLSSNPKVPSERSRSTTKTAITRSKYVNEGPQIRMDGSTIAGSMQFMSG